MLNFIIDAQPTPHYNFMQSHHSEISFSLKVKDRNFIYDYEGKSNGRKLGL